MAALLLLAAAQLHPAEIGEQWGLGGPGWRAWRQQLLALLLGPLLVLLPVLFVLLKPMQE